jgi:hypothetical protein
MRMPERIGKLLVIGAATVMLLLSIGQSPALAARQVPFEGTYSGQIAFTSPATLEYSGSGIATHLGSSAISGYIEIQGTGICSSGYRIEEHVSIWAANGDQLTIVLREQSCPVESGIYHGVGTYEVTGGTGRFDGATGQGTADGLGDFNHGLFRLTLSGTISRIGGH